VFLTAAAILYFYRRYIEFKINSFLSLLFLFNCKKKKLFLLPVYKRWVSKEIIQKHCLFKFNICCLFCIFLVLNNLQLIDERERNVPCAV